VKAYALFTTSVPLEAADSACVPLFAAPQAVRADNPASSAAAMPIFLVRACMYGHLEKS
jgi:hypothetical protein